MTELSISVQLLGKDPKDFQALFQTRTSAIGHLRSEVWQYFKANIDRYLKAVKWCYDHRAGAHEVSARTQAFEVIERYRNYLYQSEYKDSLYGYLLIQNTVRKALPPRKDPVYSKLLEQCQHFESLALEYYQEFTAGDGQLNQYQPPHQVG